MIYRMKKEQYDSLNMTHEKIIDHVNDRMGLLNNKQKSIIVEDSHLGVTQVINFESIGIPPMRMITDVIVY